MTLVVSDASPLHYLIECGAIEILPRLFGEVIIPPIVFGELQHERTPAVVRQWMSNRPSWLRLEQVGRVDETLNVDAGEREAISLALEIKAELLLIDDRRGRNEAMRRGLNVAGTIGLIEIGARAGLLNFSTAINRLRTTTARLDEEVIAAAQRRLAGSQPNS